MDSAETGKILRLLDANANRAREALRVWEDYARFILDDAELSADIKTLRHDFTELLKTILADAITHRDTPGDVGRENKTSAELTRTGIAQVVTAAGKRLGEALRAIEEFCKISHPQTSAGIEQLRYSAYDLEVRLARTLKPADRFANVSLYVLLTESICRKPWLEAAKEGIAGGADCIQLREKDLEGAEFLRRAKTLAALCREAGILCIINDRPDIAVLSGADGVHLGQGDLPPADARKIVGNRAIIGVSTHNLEQARRAVADGADYVAIGPVFPSTTKPRDFTVGLAGARQIAQAIKIPVVAIAGITSRNVDDVMASGVQAAAVSSAVLDCTDVKAAVEELKQRTKESKRQPLET